MFDRSLVTAGFDTETLVSEKYLTYLLLAQIEAGLMGLEFRVVDDNPPTNLTVKIHPPADEDYQRLYPPSLDEPLPSPVTNSLRCQLLPGEASGFLDLALMPDGQHLLTRSIDSMVRVWDLQTRTQNEQLAFEVEPAINSSFNPAGTQIATASIDHRIRIWELSTKTVIQTLTGHTLAAWCVAFSPDGQQLASGSFDQTVRVWDLQTGMLLHTLTGHDGRVTSVAFDATGTQIVSGGEDGTVRIWDAQSGGPLNVFTGHTGPVNCTLLTPNGLNIVSCSDDKTVRLWNTATGATIRTYTEHTDAVNWVDATNFRIISGSRDKSVKIWNPNALGSIGTNRDQRSEVTRVCFTGTGIQNVTVSAGGSIRIWDGTVTKPVEIRMDFMHVDAFVTVIDHNAGDQQFQGMIGLVVYLALYADRAANGLESNHILRLSLARLDEPTKFVLEQQGIDVDFVEQTLREHLDRDLPLGIAQGQQVQQIQMRKFVDGQLSTLGIYVDLALHSGPGDDYVAPRGNVTLAQSFREPAVAIAFATSPGLFALLGPDAKFRRAELAPGSSEYRYPFREDMNDSSSKELGTIDSFAVGPTFTFDAQGNVHYLGTLKIQMEGEYAITGPNIGFTANFWFNPKRNADGIVEWDSSVDIDLGLLGTLLFILGGLILLMPYMAPVGIAFWLVVGTLASLVGQQVAEHVVSKKLSETVDEESQASVLDSLPFRLTAAKRRWDPFYEAQNQIVAKLDEPMVIDHLGMAFQAEQLVLDKQPVTQVGVAPHDEVRENGAIVALRYDVPDAAQFASDFEATAPGVDRMEFLRSDPVNEPRLVTLTLDQVEARKNEQRMLAPIVLDARRINMFGGQIDRLLCVTWRVRTQQRDRLIGIFQQQTRDDIEMNELADIEQDATDDLTAKLGRAPTQEELANEVELRVQGRIAELQKDYEDGDLREHLHDALAPLLHFDIAPEELVALQERGFFTLDAKEIIVRENADGSHTPYYRDHPDGDLRDNLLSLPHYQHPYVPPSP